MRLSFFLLVLLCGLVDASNDKNVIATLNAKWASTSLIAETSEFLGKESNETFWKYASKVAEKCGGFEKEWKELKSEKKYELAVELAAGLVDLGLLDLLKFSLSLRAFSPAVQLFQQIGNEYSSVSCSAFFDLNEKFGCTPKELEEALKNPPKETASPLLSVDHVHPSSSASAPLVIVYGELGSPEWIALHKAAESLCKQGKIQYVFRHFDRNPQDERVYLSGYGVELAIKNTEYKAEDDSKKKAEEATEDETDLHGFNFKLLKELHTDSKESLDAFRMHLKEIEELAPLKQWQVQDLAFQAAQRIVNEEPHNAIAMLKELSQNFPLHARSLSRERVTRQMRDEIEANQRDTLGDKSLDPGDSALLINGINLDIDSLDMFQLLDLLKQEQRLSTGFHNIGIGREYFSLLSHIDASDEKTNYAIDYREAYPFFINNLDSDKQYKQWGNSVKLMLQPYYPGMIRPIARNLFTLVFIVNPADKESRSLLKIAQSFYQHEIPIRIGFVFVVNPDQQVSGKSDAAVALLNLYNFLSIDSSNADALSKLNKFYEDHGSKEELTAEDVKTWFNSHYSDVEYDDVFGPDSDYDKGRQIGAEFMEKTALGKAPKVLLNGYALDDNGIKSDKFEETVMYEIMKITPNIQRAVIDGRLKDRSNVANWLMEQKEVMPRLNARVLDAPIGKRYLDLSSSTPCKAETLTQFSTLTDAQQAQCILERAKYLQKSEEDITAANTLWVVGDAETVEGRELFYSALKNLKHSKSTRMTFVMNPADETKACKPNSITSLIHAAFRLLPRNQAKQFVTKLVKEENVKSLEEGKVTVENLAVGGMNVERFNKEKKQLNCDRIKMEAKFAQDVLNLKPSERIIVSNGLIIGPLEAKETFLEADFSLLDKMIEARGASQVASNVDKWEVEKNEEKASDMVLRSMALVGKYAASKKRMWLDLQGDEHSVARILADDTSKAILDVVTVVDPLSTAAQKIAPILELIRQTVNCDLKIIMNPKPKLSELPLKRFYRYVAAPQLQFDQTGRVVASAARFSSLPSKQLLTLSVHAPDAWMIEAVFAEYDLDNIKMDQTNSDVLAIFSLEHILLEGHCFDELSGSPPRGLQFVLGTPSNPTQFDTIVMANLGYFQLKANPGSWLLNLREGKSKELYKVSNHFNAERSEGDAIRVLIDSFSGRTIRVRVLKNEGMEERNLLSDESDEGIWNSISQTLNREKPEKINVFSLASGHLYERFMRIMILSVMKKTKSPVKFWLLKNYLSPQFKKSLPIMAKEYGFEYALVEYKWPRWLHQQKEKHRVMWGYKILFLDVLFPLDVQKIIFVDADQVVRSDLMELMEFDLGGAPYGYVPFCESRKEMDGFRFWKQGYWANHLAGRRYHISALYVIDLQKFRQIAAGDRLRGQYQGLSSDPNSLSNLDQDLPNNMIHQVKIKSLPQEWLWCETWCDDNSKQAAKTIDLCNNPLTKEPKLDSAIRIIPEWKSYDEEIKRVISTAENQAKKQEDKHEEL